MRWIGWLTAGSSVLLLVRMSRDADFAWYCDEAMRSFWGLYWALAAEAPVVYYTLQFSIAAAFLLAFLHRHGVLRPLGRLLFASRMERVAVPESVRISAKWALVPLGVVAPPWLLGILIYLQFTWGPISALLILASVFFAEVRRGIQRRSLRRCAPFRPFLALVAAVVVIAAEQFLQWKYGTAGIAGALLIITGLTVSLKGAGAPPLRSSRRVANVAAWIAGSRRPHLKDEWSAILVAADAPEAEMPPRARHRLARGFVYAAIRMRLADLGGPLWAPVDWLLRVERRTNALIALVVGGQAVYIVGDGGLAALVTEIWEPCAILGGALYVLVRWLRRVRGIELAAARSGEPPAE